MKYQGGKCKIAKPIMAEILKHREGEDTCVDLFCGAGAVAIEATKYFPTVLANDKHPYIVALLQAVKDGWTPPEHLSPEEHAKLKANPDLDPKLAGFAGFGCSFGGMWFHTYARGHKGKDAERNLSAESKRALLRDQPAYAKMTFTCSDYRDVVIPDNAIVYCDPPYASTHPYALTGKWDVKAFWDYVTELSKTHKVFVSEQKAPEGWVSIWERPQRRSMCNNNSTQPTITEKLFVYKEGTLNEVSGK